MVIDGPRRAACATLLAVIASAGLIAPFGCESGFQRIDRRTNELLAEASGLVGGGAPAPQFNSAALPEVDRSHADLAAERVPTVNPEADELTYTPAEEADEVLERVSDIGSDEPPLVFELEDTLAYASRHSREYKFAEEEYVLTALRLLIERHLWGPRFFDDVTAEVAAIGGDDQFDSALFLVNEFRVTQRLPYGGEVSARALASATEDLHQRVAGENVQSAELILEADLPLLRGAGFTAREDRIQAERDLIYAAREFERFRREFFFDISQEFLNLVVQQQSIENARRQVATFEELEQREQALVDAGRQPPFEAALAAQDTLFARDRLNSLLESYRLAVDQFKVRLGMPVEQPLVIVESALALPPPSTTIDAAVAIALALRLDLQNERDQVDDAQRNVLIARNALLPDLDVFGSISIPTDDARDRAGLRFDAERTDARAGVTLGLPLDREIERLNVRQAQIGLERAIRDYDQFRDAVVVDVRSSVRELDRALFSLRLQEENIRIAERRMASLEAAPERATARDRSEAADALTRAEDERDQAFRDLQVAIMRYLLDTGQLRVAPDGNLLPLPGMILPAPPVPPATP